MRRGFKVDPEISPSGILNSKGSFIMEMAERWGCHILVETGSCTGDMVYFLKDQFDELYTIELKKDLYEYCVLRFKNYSHIHPVFGDSSKVLEDILGSLKGRVLFFLDAHYSGGITVKSKYATAAVQELHAIFKKGLQENIILIDDVDSFEHDPEWMKVSEVQDVVRQLSPASDFAVLSGMMVITPHERRQSG